MDKDLEDFKSDQLLEPKKMMVWSGDEVLKPREYVLPTRNNQLDDDIPTIPDFEDYQDVLDKDTKVTSLQNQTKSTLYEELDTELLKQQTFSLDDVDLSVLLNNLHCDDRKEADMVWTVDTLLNELIAEDDRKKTE